MIFLEIIIMFSPVVKMILFLKILEYENKGNMIERVSYDKNNNPEVKISYEYK